MKLFLFLILVSLTPSAFAYQTLEQCAADLNSRGCNVNGYCWSYEPSYASAMDFCRRYIGNSSIIDCAKSKVAPRYNISTGQVIQDATSVSVGVLYCN